MATLRASFVAVADAARADTGMTMPVADLSTAVRLTDRSTSNSSAIVQSGGEDWVAPRAGIVRLVCEGAVHVAAGTAPTAAATAGIYIPADTVELVTVAAGHKIAVVDA